MNNIERNVAKIIIILISYVVATKTNAQREIYATTTTIITSYNNINQQKQLKKVKREKTLIFKIKKQSEKNNLRMFFVKKLIERLQRIEKMKENVMTTKHFFNEDVKLITRSKKIKNRLTINNSLMKSVASSAYTMSRIFEILTHKMQMIDVQTNNQQKIIRRIKKQNEILYSSLRIARIIWLKNVINTSRNDSRSQSNRSIWFRFLIRNQIESKAQKSNHWYFDLIWFSSIWNQYESTAKETYEDVEMHS